MADINRNILKWARETAGLTLEQAAKAIQLNAARGVSGADRLEALERGEGEPSRVLLQRMAEKYRRPLITFYLKDRPATGDRGTDFRRILGAPPPEFDPQLDALIRNISASHALAKSLLEDEEAAALAFIGSHQPNQDPEVVAESIRTTIKFDLQTFRNANNVDTAFSYLRNRLESQRIFVVLVGNLGSHHSNIPTSAFRGYAIADPIAPFIIINDNDAHAAWSFTAFHEAVHLWLGQTGISGLSNEAGIERFCNDVAGRLLLAPDELRQLANVRQLAFDNAVAEISAFASERNISRQMVAYQLLRRGTIDQARYGELSVRFHEDWLKSKARDKAGSTDKNGPSYYVVRRHRLGHALLSLARRASDGGTLPPTKAAQLLGVKPASVHSLLHPETA